MLGIENYRPDVKAECFEVPPGFFINRLVFGGNFLPIKVLFFIKHLPVAMTNSLTIPSFKLVLLIM